MAQDQIKRGEGLSDKGGRTGQSDINPEVPGQAPTPGREHLSDTNKDPNIGQGRRPEEQNTRDPITDLERKGSGAV